MSRKDAARSPIIADEFTAEQIADHRDRTLAHLSASAGLWPGMVRLPSGERAGNVGKLVARLGTPLRHLFAAITPAEGDDEQAKADKEALAAVFHSMLGKEDHGKDDARFEADLLVRRLDRVEAEQKIVDALDELRTRFADDALNTGEMVVGPGLRALEVARTAAASNPAFKSLLAPVLNALGDLTKGARRHQAAARKAAEQEKPAEPK